MAFFIMTLHFSKYQGTGNDFVLIDNRNETFPKSEELIRHLCDRNFGIGSDGLILIENHQDFDYRMLFFNPDGSESLCGNGSRCGFQFARRLQIVDESATFETTDGIHHADLVDEEVRFNLFDIKTVDRMDEDYYVHTGSPHYVIFVDDIEKIDVQTQGRDIRYSEPFVGQNGTNVNFAQLLHGAVKVRTYERGVENETRSCGTGVTAVGLVAGALGVEAPITVHTEGGTLEVDFEKSADGYKNIWLKGPAEHVYDGKIEIQF